MASARVGSLVIALGATLLVSRVASAHDPRTEVSVVGERIEVRAFYSDGRKAAGTEVKLIAAGGNVVHEGRTDRSGKWSFPRPPDGEYRIVWDAGDGHADEKKLVLRPPADSSASSGPVPCPSSVQAESDDFEAATQTPWLRLAIGVAAILGLAFAIVLARRASRSKPTAP